jgi:hypothetical protein
MLKLMNFHRVRSVRVLSAVLGASVVVTMGAATVAYSGYEAAASPASPNSVTEPTITPTPHAPPEPKISFASPTIKGIPCGKRQTMPCST